MIALPVIALVTGALPGPGALNAWAGSPTHYPVAVVICTTPDQGSAQELPTAYYQDMFTSGTGGADDWFKDVSRGSADLGGSQVLGPYTVTKAGPAYPPGTSMTLQRANGLRRYDRIQACAGAAADAGVSLSSYQGIIAVYVPHEKDPAFEPPNAVTTLAAPAAATDTTIQVASAAGFPTPPFPILVGVGDPQHGGTLKELIDVTAESGVGDTTWTVARGFEEGGPHGLNNCAQGGPSPSNGVALASGLQVEVPYTADGGACLVGRVGSFTVGSITPQTLTNVGLVAMDPLMSLAALPHEMSHALFGLVHSSDLNVQSDYQDAWDMMSAQNTYRSASEPGFVQSFGYDHNPEGYGWSEGPGFNSVNLDNLGWLASSDEDTALLSASSCTTRSDTLDPLSIKSPSSGDLLEVQLPFTNQAGFPTGQNYTVELRSPVQGSNYTVWDGAVPETVLVHLAGKASAFPSYLVDSNLSGALEIQGAQPGGFSGGAPQFVAGSTFVDPTSHAYLAVNQIDSTTHTALVTIGNCALPTTISYSGDTTDDFNDTATLAATLTTNPGSGPSGAVPDQPVTLTLGSQSCSATTDASGHAVCTVVLDQTPGITTVMASFGGTAAYSPASTSAPFTITREETTTTYTGPTVIAQNQPVTLSANLLEDGTTPISGRVLTLTVGSQSCTTGPTDVSGSASCLIPLVNVAQGTEPVTAVFAGDAYYLPSSDASHEAVVFAFPSRGDFALGDATVATATGPVTWWGASWASLNVLSGGPVSPSFKGFTATPGTNPPACGGIWTSSPGNSSRPVGDVPSYMGVVVSSQISKDGRTISGDVVKIVVVHTDPGYAPDPGKAGTGTIVATYC